MPSTPFHVENRRKYFISSFLALLILPSAYASLGRLAIEFFIALYFFDIPRVERLARRFVPLIGEALISRMLEDLLGRAVSPSPP